MPKRDDNDVRPRSARRRAEASDSKFVTQVLRLTGAKLGRGLGGKRGPEFDWHANGRLTLNVGGWPSRKWNDTERSLIDTRLPGIVATIVSLAETKRAREEEKERRQRSYDEALTRHKAQVRTRKHERRELRALFRDARRLQRANRLREFIAAVEDHARQAGELTAEKQQWIAWASAKADWVDPLVRRSDPILDTPEPEAPSYWRF